MLPNAPPSAHRRRGVALLMVLLLCGVVTVMSLAMLAASTAQVRAVDNAARAASAESLADSGVSLAMYYLLRPEESPVPLVQAGPLDTVYYPGETALALGTDGGTVDVAVQMTAPNVYRITATGRDGGGEIARRKICEVAVTVDNAPRYAAGLAGEFKLDSSWSVDDSGAARGVRGGELVNPVAPSVAGPVWASNGGPGSNSQPVPIFPRDAGVPLSKTRYAGGMAVAAPFTYTYQGMTCQAKQLTYNPSSALRDYSSGNPANVWYADQDITVNGNVPLDGTLVLRGGHSLTVYGAMQVNPRSGMPALVVQGNLILASGFARLKTHGYTCVGGRITCPDLAFGCVLDVSGALCVGFEGNTGGRQMVDAGYSAGAIHLAYDPAVLDLPDFLVPRDPMPLSVEVTNWDVKP